MSKESTIKEILMKKLQSVYCDTCKFNYTESDSVCEMCHRKSMEWSISELEAEEITKLIILSINEPFTRVIGGHTNV